MPFTPFGRSLLLACAFLGAPPPKLYLAVYRKSGKGEMEVLGGAYARQPLENKLDVANGKLTNFANIDFAVATADWGTVTSFAIVDEDGNELVREETRDQHEITVGKRLRVPKGMVEVRLGNAE